MVPPSFFVSGGVALLHACSVCYVAYKRVKRFRSDCEKLASFVRKIEAFIMQTEDETDMTGPGWQAAFSALHESLVEVADVFEMCGKIGMIRSMINADDLNLRLNAIAQRLNLALQLIPIQKAKANEQRLANLEAIQVEIRAATFAAVSAAEQQSAALKRLIDQSRVDASKTQEMLEQVLRLLQSDSCGDSDAAGPSGAGRIMGVDRALLQIEVADLQSELDRAKHMKRSNEEAYLSQIILAITAMEPALAPCLLDEQAPPPSDLCCPITRQLMVDPVMLVESSQTYDRAAIQEWLDRGNLKDPVTGIDITTTLLVPNVLVRKFVQQFKQQQQADTDSAADQGSVVDGIAVRSLPAQATSSAAAAAAAAAAAGANHGDLREDSVQLAGGYACSLHHSSSSLASSGRPYVSCGGMDSTVVYPSISPQQQQQPELGFAGLRLRAHQVQQHAPQGMSPFVAAVPHRHHSSSPMAGGSYGAAHLPAGAPAGGQQGPFQLGELHAALNRVGDGQYQMARRHNGAHAAEAVLQMQQHVQQERQQQEDRAYLQQHMDRLLLLQQPMQQQPAHVPAVTPRRSSISSSEAWPQAAAAAAAGPLPAAHLPPSDHASDHDGSLPLQAPPPLHHYCSPEAASASGSAAVMPAGRRASMASASDASAARMSSELGPGGRPAYGSAVPPRAPLHPDRAQSSPYPQCSGPQAVPFLNALSAPDLGKRGKSGSSSRGIDRSSIDKSSEGSKAKRGLGARVLTKLKAVSYFMVYDDEKC